MTPEGKIKIQIKRYLDSLGARHFWPVQTGYGKPALDCIACIQGQYVEIEVKRPGLFDGTPRQKLIIEEVHKAGGLSFVTDSLARTKRLIEDHVLRKYDYERDA